MRNLHWWHDRWKGYTMQEWKDKATMFYYPHELKEAIKQYPLTQELILEFMANHIGEIRYSFFTAINPSESQSYKFDILISKEAVDDLKAEGCIHECAHGIYRVGNQFYQSQIEGILNVETDRFFKVNYEFSHEVRRRLESLAIN